MLKSVKLFCVDHGKMANESWKIIEKSWNLIPGNRWEPCFKAYVVSFGEISLL